MFGVGSFGGGRFGPNPYDPISSINSMSPDIFAYVDATTDISSLTDRSGNGRHCTQTDPLDQPALVQVGADYALQFDKDDGTGGDELDIPYDWLSGAGAATILVCYRKTENVTQTLLSFNNLSGFRVKWISGTSLAIYVGGAGNNLIIGSQNDTSSPHVMLVQYDGDGYTHSDRIKVAIDGVFKTGTRNGTIPTTIPAITSGKLGSNASTEGMEGEVFLIVGWSRVLTADELSRAYVATKALETFAAALPSAGTDLTESETVLGIGTAVNETATGITLTPGSTTVVTDNGGPHAGFPHIIANPTAPNFRCTYRLGTAHSDNSGKVVYRDSANDCATWGAETTMIDAVDLDDREGILVDIAGTQRVDFYRYDGTVFQTYSRVAAGGAETNVSGYEFWAGADRHTNRAIGYATNKWVINGGPGVANAGDPRRVGLVDRNTGVNTLRWLKHTNGHLDESGFVDTGTAQIIVNRRQTLADPTVEDFMVMTRSLDGGTTWSDWQPFSVKCSAPWLFKHSSGTVYLAFKWHDAGTTRTGLMWSNDHGVTWGAPTIVYTHVTTDASYPDIEELSDGSLVIVHYEPRYIRATVVAIS